MLEAVEISILLQLCFHTYKHTGGLMYWIMPKFAQIFISDLASIDRI
jgi:hypothetical protein